MTTFGEKHMSWDVDAVLNNKQSTSAKGQANGYAGLDANGQVPTDQLPAGGSPHTHPISEVDDLQATLDGKAATSHAHVKANITDFAHSHVQSDVTNLVTDLAGKAASSHSHAQSDITNLVSDLAGKAATSHSHGLADLTPVTASRLLGRGSAGGNGASQEITLGTNLTMSGTTLNATGGGSGLAHDSLMMPPFFRYANLTAVTALATNTSYFVYLGKVSSAITTLDLRCRVTTAAATITWAEVGVFTGAPVLAGNASLTRRGFTNVAATFNSTGLKSTTVSLSGVSANDEVWLAFGSQATTPYQVRGGLADDIQAGWYASVAGRISTLGTPVTVTLASATLVPPWCAAKL